MNKNVGLSWSEYGGVSASAFGLSISSRGVDFNPSISLSYAFWANEPKAVRNTATPKFTFSDFLANENIDPRDIQKWSNSNSAEAKEILQTIVAKYYKQLGFKAKVTITTDYDKKTYTLSKEGYYLEKSTNKVKYGYTDADPTTFITKLIASKGGTNIFFSIYEKFTVHISPGVLINGVDFGFGYINNEIITRSVIEHELFHVGQYEQFGAYYFDDYDNNSLKYEIGAWKAQSDFLIRNGFQQAGFFNLINFYNLYYWRKPN